MRECNKCIIKTHLCEYSIYAMDKVYYCRHPANEFDGLCSCEACPLLNKTFETNVFHNCLKEMKV